MSRHSEGFSKLLEASDKLGEHRDCTVKAITAATGESYEICHSAMAKLGRKNRQGSTFRIMIKACKALGYNMERMNHLHYKAKTMKTAARDPRLASGSYICETSHHAAAVVDGNVIDWTTGRLHRIKDIYTVSPISGFVPAVINSINIPSHNWLSIPSQQGFTF